MIAAESDPRWEDNVAALSAVLPRVTNDERWGAGADRCSPPGHPVSEVHRGSEVPWGAWRAGSST